MLQVFLFVMFCGLFKLFSKSQMVKVVILYCRSGTRCSCHCTVWTLALVEIRHNTCSGGWLMVNSKVLHQRYWTVTAITTYL